MPPNRFEKELLLFENTPERAKEGLAILTIDNIYADSDQAKQAPDKKLPPLRLELEVR